MINRAVYFFSEYYEGSKTAFVVVVARTVSDFYSFKRENITFYGRRNESSENVVKV